MHSCPVAHPKPSRIPFEVSRLADELPNYSNRLTGADEVELTPTYSTLRMLTGLQAWVSGLTFGSPPNLKIRKKYLKIS